MLDKLLGENFEPRNDRAGCGYQGYEFGANYLDSVCIEGYLWDADSGDAEGDGWVYTNGGEIPCPWCNHAEWLEGALSELQDEGFNAEREDECRHPEKSRFAEYGDRMRDAWMTGFRAGQAESASYGETSRGR